MEWSWKGILGHFADAFGMNFMAANFQWLGTVDRPAIKHFVRMRFYWKVTDWRTFDGSRDLCNNLLAVKLSLKSWGWLSPSRLVERSSKVHLCEVVTGHLLIELRRYVTCEVVIRSCLARLCHAWLSYPGVHWASASWFRTSEWSSHKIPPLKTLFLSSGLAAWSTAGTNCSFRKTSGSSQPCWQVHRKFQNIKDTLIVSGELTGWVVWEC